MSVVAPSQSTYAQIEQKVRYLTASPGQSSLTSEAIAQYINDVYSSDFAYGIKLDVMRKVYTFYTEPYKDRYPLDVNYQQGVRAPLYVDGIQGTFYKDRQLFYNIWPRFPTKFQPTGLTQGTITGITQANPAIVTSIGHGLVSGDEIYISGVTGMTEVDGFTFSLTYIDANSFSLNGIDSTAYTAYVSGGTWANLNLAFDIAAPFLSNTFCYGTTSISGSAINISDNGNGILYLQTPNPVVSVPAYGATSSGAPIPGMYNLNTANPGLDLSQEIGTVNYVTGAVTIDFSLVPGTYPDTAVQATVWASQYEPSKPWSMMFWNNEFHIRPVPKVIHKVEIEVYLTPVQFLLTTDVPILNQWWKYLALLASRQILLDRQDMDGVANLEVELKRQEGLVLERQAVEEIGQQNETIYNQTEGSGVGNSSGWYGGGFY